MIQVQGLTKTYRGRAVVDGISFEAGRGEIVGFLGPNGAGKSTTMRILSGFLLPTSGKVEIAGHDIVEESLQARRHLGYMPEDVPLYPEMRVEEYLRYRAGIKGVPRDRLTARVTANMERCGVAQVARKLIGTLSKGYRQRIGLADALVHDPEILILDEPTNGLDPNQIRSVREIIRSLAGQHTVLLSTHILAEVEAVCERVIILDGGRIKATGDPASLARRLERGARLALEAKGPGTEAMEKALLRVVGVSEVRSEALPGDWTRFELGVRGGEDPREEIFRVVNLEQWSLRHLSMEPATLEEIFAGLTAESGREIEPQARA
ncbi:MAG: ABC-2 type transport system ATP-binding protein [Verrucomicrobia bacterium]|jgi:ABC-2 type transport system ATP-binding protein|nr:MAG: ABC-2 type transport system ATP-binding protein [Verrucomicrobiota bacterium]